MPDEWGSTHLTILLGHHEAYSNLPIVVGTLLKIVFMARLAMFMQGNQVLSFLLELLLQPFAVQTRKASTKTSCWARHTARQAGALGYGQIDAPTPCQLKIALLIVQLKFSHGICATCYLFTLLTLGFSCYCLGRDTSSHICSSHHIFCWTNFVCVTPNHTAGPSW